MPSRHPNPQMQHQPHHNRLAQNHGHLLTGKMAKDEPRRQLLQNTCQDFHLILSNSFPDYLSK